MKRTVISLSLVLTALFFLDGCIPSFVKDAASGNYNGVLRSLNEGQDTIDIQQALCYASEKGHLKIVQLLVQKGAQINFHPLAQGYSQWHDNPHTEPAMYYAIKHDHVEIVKYLVENGAPVNLDPAVGEGSIQVASYSQLFQAVHEGSIQVASYLLTKGADANEFYTLTRRDSSDQIVGVGTFRVIYRAVSTGNEAMVRLLKSKGAVIPKGKAVLVAGYRLSPYWNTNQPSTPVFATRLWSIDGKNLDQEDMAELSPGIHSVVIKGWAMHSARERTIVPPITINVECKEGDLLGVHPVSSRYNWNVIVRKY